MAPLDQLFDGERKIMKKLAFAIVGTAALALAACNKSNQDAVENAEINQPDADQLNELANQAAMDAANAQAAQAAAQAQAMNEQNAAIGQHGQSAGSRRAKRQRHVIGRWAAGERRSNSGRNSHPGSRAYRRTAGIADGRTRRRNGFCCRRLVFPGGRIDDGDRRLGEELGIDPAAVAAIRETIEETAIPVGLSPAPDAAAARAIQDELVADRPFDELLYSRGIELDARRADAIRPLGSEISRRASVRHPVLHRPMHRHGDWEPRVIEGECAAPNGYPRREVLELDRSGEARLIFPTRRNLERLAQHPSFDAIRADAMAHPIEPVTPWVEERTASDSSRSPTIWAIR